MNLTLLDLRQVDTGSISFNNANYHFVDKTTGEDITNLITRADKVANWSGFDVYKDNSRLSAEQPATRNLTGQPQVTIGPVEDLPSGWLFTAEETARETASDITQVAKSSTNTLIIVGAVAAAAYLLLSGKSLGSLLK